MASEPTTALITGGTSGIGRAVVRLSSRQGGQARPITGTVPAVDAGRASAL
ncbi:hypothetical protein FB559_4547 [Actinoallomurus bryophytorum]|uniref:Short subunit dehydrogenase n=1 Tax=Actinoallomurus bryophytorum TaxID=1490222 RepID=A0A543CP76_9ACTN|nr:hypothetical protein [Actinoallomurus bryophytorum]TQL98899.1 hypothetical protein FB559_4547 [Actinoallomurus bryophytorum]